MFLEVVVIFNCTCCIECYSLMYKIDLWLKKLLYKLFFTLIKFQGYSNKLKIVIIAEYMYTTNLMTTKFNKIYDNCIFTVLILNEI